MTDTIDFIGLSIGRTQLIVLIVGLVVSAFAAVYDINRLGDLTSVGTLVAFGLVCFSVIWLRYQRPDLDRHFKVPFFPILPGLGVLACFALAYIGVEQNIRIWFMWFVLIAIAVYFIYPYWVSPLRNKAREAG